MNNFSKNLRYLREKNNYTQNDMKMFFGIGNTTWSHYENGKSQPSLEGLIRISNFFGITLNELVVEDLARRDGADAIRQHVDKPYVLQETYSKLEEQAGLNYIVKELRKLRHEMDAMKQSGRK